MVIFEECCITGFLNWTIGWMICSPRSLPTFILSYSFFRNRCFSIKNILLLFYDTKSTLLLFPNYIHFNFLILLKLWRSLWQLRFQYILFFFNMVVEFCYRIMYLQPRSITYKNLFYYYLNLLLSKSMGRKQNQTA